MQEAGYSYVGESDDSLEFVSDHIEVRFLVEQYSSVLEVRIKFLSGSAPDNEYRLATIMEIYHNRSLMRWFGHEENPEDRERVVNGYFQFLTQHKNDLFGEVFPLAQEYKKYNQFMIDALHAHFKRSKKDPHDPLPYVGSDIPFQDSVVTTVKRVYPEGVDKRIEEWMESNPA